MLQIVLLLSLEKALHEEEKCMGFASMTFGLAWCKSS
jgi:hypothetical protein